MLTRLFLCLLLPIIWGAEIDFQGLDKVPILSYNTTPAEEEKPLRWEYASLLSKAYDHMAWPHGFGSSWPHISVGCFRADHTVFCSSAFLLAAASARLMVWPIFRWPHLHFRGASFDHILEPRRKAYTNIASSARHVYSLQQSWNFWKISFCSSVMLFSKSSWCRDM